jgi:hypothetical protein
LRNLITITAAVTVITFAAFLFTSCADNGSPTEESRIEWSTAEIFTIDDGNDIAGSSDTDDGGKESDEYAKKIISEALDAFSLFISSVPEIDRDDSIEYEEGLVYYRVVDKRLNTFEKLKDYLLRYFSEEIAIKLLNVERYMEFDDGSLYVLDINMSTGFDILSEKYTVLEQTEDREVFSVTVVRDKDGDGAADDTQTYNFVREKAEDGGNMVFTEFTYFR